MSGTKIASANPEIKPSVWIGHFHYEKGQNLSSSDGILRSHWIATRDVKKRKEETKYIEKAKEGLISLERQKEW